MATPTPIWRHRCWRCATLRSCRSRLATRWGGAHPEPSQRPPIRSARAYRAPAGRTARRSGLAERSPRRAGAERATPRAGLTDSDVAGCRDQRGSGGLLRKAELLDFKQSLLELAERRVAVTGDDAGAELRETDLKVLAAEAARFQHRLVFWQRRLREFESASVTNSE